MDINGIVSRYIVAPSFHIYTVLLGTILCTLLAQHWQIDAGYVVEKM